VESHEFAKLLQYNLYQIVKLGKKLIVNWLVFVDHLKCIWVKIKILGCKLKCIEIKHIIDVNYRI
jgi:hypothetical protein